MVTRLNLPHAMVVRLHVRKSNVVILTPETALIVGVRAVAYPWLLLRVALARANALLGLMVRARRGGEGLPNVFWSHCVEPGVSPQPVFNSVQLLFT